MAASVFGVTTCELISASLLIIHYFPLQTQFTPRFEDFCRRVQTGLVYASFEQKRRLVELLIDRVLVSNDEIEVWYVVPTHPWGETTRFCHLRKDYFNHIVEVPAVPGSGSSRVTPGLLPLSFILVWPAAIEKRRAVLDTAFLAHSERFVRKPPQPFPAPKKVWINKPQSAFVD